MKWKWSGRLPGVTFQAGRNRQIVIILRSHKIQFSQIFIIRMGPINTLKDYTNIINKVTKTQTEKISTNFEKYQLFHDILYYLLKLLQKKTRGYKEYKYTYQCTWLTNITKWWTLYRINFRCSSFSHYFIFLKSSGIS